MERWLTAAAGRAGAGRRPARRGEAAGPPDALPCAGRARLAARPCCGRWQQVRDLHSQGVGFADCTRRPGLAMNTVRRYDRAEAPERLRRAAQYRPTLVDPYRDYLRKRRTEEPGVPVRRLLREIRELGYPGSSNLLVRYLNQGRADAPRSHLSPRKVAQLPYHNGRTEGVNTK